MQKGGGGGGGRRSKSLRARVVGALVFLRIVFGSRLANWRLIIASYRRSVGRISYIIRSGYISIIGTTKLLCNRFVPLLSISPSHLSNSFIQFLHRLAGVTTMNFLVLSFMKIEYISAMDCMVFPSPISSASMHPVCWLPSSDLPLTQECMNSRPLIWWGRRDWWSLEERGTWVRVD